MKLLGISCGRRMGNSEILLREALMGAAEYGVETEVLSLLDVDVKPCIGCKECKAEITGKEDCVIKDDAVFVWNKIMDCDGLIISGPVYCLTPPGYLFVIRDRLFGSKSDVAWMMERKKLKARGEKVFVDERCFKTRPGAFISVGGSVTPDWLSLGLSLFQTMTFSIQLEVVDQQMVLGTNIVKGQVLLNDTAMARARKLGKHVAAVMGKPATAMKWRGDEPGTCPVCHQNEITIKGKNPVQCPICGIYGELKIENGEIKVIFSEAEQKRSRLTLAGKMEHWDEYHPADPEQAWAANRTSTMPPAKQKEYSDEIKKKLAKYKADKPCVKPPRVKKPT
ncbi:MAG: flavodoxin family protein [Dehalococcoidales bacterium]|jgi:multimeric flavodoxin WrbA